MADEWQMLVNSMLQALGIRFYCVGASESCSAYRDVIVANSGKKVTGGKGHIEHLYDSLESMLLEKTCVLHQAQVQGSGQCACSLRRGEVNLGVTGSPCNPFSLRRTKRFADGSVAAHSMSDTTFESVVGFYQRYEPRVGVSEQVLGFDMKTSSSDPTTPYQRQGRLFHVLINFGSECDIQNVEESSSYATAHVAWCRFMERIGDCRWCHGGYWVTEDDAWQLMLQGMLPESEDDLPDPAAQVPMDAGAGIVVRDGMYGAPDMLRSLGTQFHRRVSERFLATANTWTRGQARAPLSVSAVLDEVVRNPRMASRASMAATVRVPEATLKEAILQMACSLLYASALLVGAFICSWMSLFRVRPQRFAPIAVISRFTYDETPLKLRLQEHRAAFQVEAGADTNFRGLVKTGEETYVHSKILNVDWRMGLLVRDCCKDSYCLISVDMPAPLSSLDANTGENEFKALSLIEERIPELRALKDACPLSIRMAVMDSFGANFRVERAHASLHPKQKNLILACSVHKTATCNKKSMEIAPGLVSGVVQVGLALRDTGSVGRMQGLLQEIFWNDLEIVCEPEPAGEASQMREQLLDLYCPLRIGGQLSVQNARRQYILRSMANSDWSSASIRHHCTFSCCSSPEDTRRVFMTLVTWALIPHNCPILQRKNWTGGERAYTWLGLLSNCWGLAARIFSKIRGGPTGEPSASTECDQEEQEPWADFFADMLRDRATAEAQALDKAMEEPAEPNQSAETFAEENHRNRQTACQFVAALSLEPEILTVARQAMNPGLRLLQGQLEMAGEEWEARQQTHAATQGHRLYRVLQAARGTLVNTALQEALQMLWNLPLGIPSKAYRRRLRTLLFSFLGTFVAKVHFYLRRAHNGFPYQLFCVLLSSEECARVYRIPKCFRDDLAAAFFERYPEPADGMTDEAQALLEGVALMSCVDVSTLESSHSTIREWTQMRGRGHTPSFVDVSAQSFCRWVGTRYDGMTGQKFAEQRRAAKEADKAEKESKKSRRGSSSGGGYKSFVSSRCQGQKLSRELCARLSQEYRNLSEDEFQHFQEVGRAATLASRMGAWPARLILGCVTKPYKLQGTLQVADPASEMALVAHTGMDWGQVERFVPGQSFQERERFFSRQVRSETAQARKQRVADAAVQERPQQDIQQMNPTVAAALRVHGGSGLLAKCTQVADVRSPRRSVQHVFWRPPATQMAEVTMSSSYAEGRQVRKHELVQEWQRLHATIRNKDQPRLQTSAEAYKGLKECGLRGVCVCSEEARPLRLFCKKLASHLRQVFKQGKNAPTNPLRTVLSEGRAVLRFRRAGALDAFFFLGHVNFRTWEFAGVRLHFDGMPQGQTLRLKVGIPGHAEEDDSSTWLSEIQTREEFVKSCLDLQQPCHVGVCGILRDSKELLMDDMPARIVEVEVLRADILQWRALDPYRRRQDLGARREERPRRRPEPGAVLLDDEEAEASDHRSGSEDEVNADAGGVGSVDFGSGESDEEDEGEAAEQDRLDSLLDALLEAAASAEADQEIGDPAGPEDAVPHVAPEMAAEMRSMRRLLRLRKRTPGLLRLAMVMARPFRQHAQRLQQVKGGQSGQQRQRQTLQGKRGGAASGKPIGHLLAWLAEAGDHANHISHVEALPASQADRQSQRDWFLALDGGRKFAEHELPPEDGAEINEV
ncbi:unnamed protein product, partial [Symbiodinium necroappetens]